jgi:hypothetical protein
VPTLPSCLLEPISDQFRVLLPERPTVAATHPLGCHRRRIPDRLVFEHVVAALVHGSGYERIASSGCSDRTIRRRLKEWAAATYYAQLDPAPFPGAQGRGPGRVVRGAWLAPTPDDRFLRVADLDRQVVGFVSASLEQPLEGAQRQLLRDLA